MKEYKKEDFKALEINKESLKQKKMDVFNKGILITLIIAIISVSAFGYFMTYSHKDRWYMLKDNEATRINDPSLVSQHYSVGFSNNLLSVNPANAKKKLIKVGSMTIEKTQGRKFINKFIFDGYFDVTLSQRVNRVFNLLEVKTTRSKKTNGYVSVIKGIQSNINKNGIENLSITLTVETAYTGITKKNELGYSIYKVNLERVLNQK